MIKGKYWKGCMHDGNLSNSDGLKLKFIYYAADFKTMASTDELWIYIIRMDASQT